MLAINNRGFFFQCFSKVHAQPGARGGVYRVDSGDGEEGGYGGGIGTIYTDADADFAAGF